MNTEKVDEIIDRHGCEPSSLIQVLLEIQSAHHWLPREALERVAERLEVPMTRIQHIATFYKAFSLVPKGRHEIHICMGTACHVRGAARVLDAVEDATGIKPGETTPDGRFTLIPIVCLGACDRAPAMMIDDDLHGNLTPEKVDHILEDYR